jgi:hypothetical protein
MNRHLAITNTHASVVTINGDTDAWDEDGNVVVLDESLITTELARLQSVYDADAYQRTRAAAYPELKEQLDLLYHDMTAGKLDATGEWHKAVKAVKDATAKPS